jgi:cytochrome c2
MRASAAAVLVVLAIGASGCGSGSGGVVDATADKAHGKQLFMEKCAACHTLEDAKAAGKIGPNLDASFKPDYEQGFDESTVRQVVAGQIRWPGQYGEGGPDMPPNLVTGDDVDAVAAYVAFVAGRPENTVQAAAAPPATTTTEQPPGGGGGAGGAEAAAGKKAFADNGCAACHTFAPAGASGTVGPDLDKLPDFAQTAGKPLDAFIHESIVDPEAYVEKGYPKGVMPSFSSLPPSTVDALVAFLSQSGK